MSLDVQIKVDPGNSVQAADKVTAALHKTEDEGIAAQKAMDNLTGTFKRLAQTMAIDLKRQNDELNKSLSAGGKAFDGLTAAIAREREMLDRIHGPMQRLQQDIQVLDKLHRDGKISAEQHAQALLKSGQAAGIASKGVGAATGGADLSSIAAKIGKLNVGQVAGGANQAFELLNQKLAITDSALGQATGSAIKFGAAGAQIAGPWGAALGAVISLSMDAGEAIGDWLSGRTAESIAAANAARQYLEVIRQEESLWGQATAAAEEHRAGLDALYESTRHLREAKERLIELEKSDTSKNQAIDLLAAQSDGYQKLTNDVRAYALALIELQDSGATGARAQRTGLELLRGQRDAMTAQALAAKGFSQAVIDQHLAINKRNDSLLDAVNANLQGVTTTNMLKESVTGLGFAWDKATTAVEKYNEVAWARKEDIAGVDTISGGADVGTFRSQTAGMRIRADGDVPVPGVPSGIDWERIAAANRDAQDALTEYNRKLEESATIGDIMRDQFVGSAREFSSVLVDAANGADVGWGDFFNNMLVGLQKAIAQALILKAITGSVTGAAGAGGYGGLFGLLGFATGGDAMMGRSQLARIPAAATGMDAVMRGAGPTDSRLAMIRMTPGESLHVRTPEQRQSAARSSGAAPVNIINQAADPRALLPMLNTPAGERAILNVMQKYPDAVRALIR
jgi:hypothetical protein